jgi:hypothetical protein
MKLMRSDKWISAADTEASKFSLKRRCQPYILRSGHISGSAYLSWRCSPYQWLSTTIRAVYERIRARSVVWKRCSKKHRDALAGIAILYVLTQDDVMLERLLNCKRSGFTRTFHYYKSNKLDHKTKVLYDQMALAISWLKLRGKPRAPSKHQRHHVLTQGEVRSVREICSSLSSPWIDGGGFLTNGGHWIGPRSIPVPVF